MYTALINTCVKINLDWNNKIESLEIVNLFVFFLFFFFCSQGQIIVKWIGSFTAKEAEAAVGWECSSLVSGELSSISKALTAFNLQQQKGEKPSWMFPPPIQIIHWSIDHRFKCKIQTCKTTRIRSIFFLSFKFYFLNSSMIWWSL